MCKGVFEFVGNKIVCLIMRLKQLHKRKEMEKWNKYKVKHYEQAIARAKKALEIAEKKLDSKNPDLYEFLEDLGSVYLRAAEYHQAALYFERSFLIIANTCSPVDPKLIYSEHCLAIIKAKLAQGR